jgi:hypothetical protein
MLVPPQYHILFVRHRVRSHSHHEDRTNQPWLSFP